MINKNDIGHFSSLFLIIRLTYWPVLVVNQHSDYNYFGISLYSGNLWPHLKWLGESSKLLNAHTWVISELNLRNEVDDVPDAVNSNRKLTCRNRLMLERLDLSECLCLNSHRTNLSSQSTGREKISSFPFFTFGMSTFSLLKVPIFER